MAGEVPTEPVPGSPLTGVDVVVELAVLDGTAMLVLLGRAVIVREVTEVMADVQLPSPLPFSPPETRVGLDDGTSADADVRCVVRVLKVEGVDDEALTLEEEDLLVAGDPDEAPHVATLGPGMAYGFPPLSGCPLFP